MMHYFIYRLHINDTTIYIGITDFPPSRYYGHKYDCFYKNGKTYNSRLYKTIRQIGITKKNFSDYVKMEILYNNVPFSYAELTENLVIRTYLDWGHSLWNTTIKMV